MNALTGQNSITFALATIFVAIGLALAALNFIKTLWYRTGTIVFLFFASLLIIGIKLQLIQLTVVAFLYCTLIFLIWLGSWLGSKIELERIAEFGDYTRPCYDEIKSYSLINKIQPDFLTIKQLNVFNEHRVFSHIALGNCDIAKRLLNEGSFEPALKHFALGAIANGEGDCRRAERELNDGFAAVSNNTDRFILLQLEHNRAIEHINNGQFRIANDELEKVRNKVRLSNVHNGPFLNLLYSNLVLNKTRLDLADRGQAEGWELIDEYSNDLDLSSGTDRGTLFNLKLMFLRQLGAKNSEKAKIFKDEVEDTISNKKLTEEQRTVAMASLARIAWADGLDPASILDYFGSHDLSFNDMRPENRIAVFKNLSISTGSLMSDNPNLTIIKDGVAAYLEHGIKFDLDAWENSLPAEAIRIRAAILKERAALCQSIEANSDQAIVYLKEAIAMLEHGLQIKDALQIRWKLAKILIASKPEDALRQLSMIQERLAELGSHPALGYPYYELSLCYGLLGMGHDCRVAFEKAVSFKTAMDHYSPTVRRDVVAASFCARFYLMLDVLSSPDRLILYLHTSEGKDWIRRYPEKVNVLSVVILLGRFFGYQGPIPVVRRDTDIGGNYVIASFWISVPELGLAFDPNINKITGQRGGVFLQNGHPLVSPDSNYEVLMQRSGLKPLPVAYKPCDEGDLCDEDRIGIQDVLEALNIACRHERPTTEDLLEYYHNGCEDVPIDQSTRRSQHTQ
jgi:hypothetical protein